MIRRKPSSRHILMLSTSLAPSAVMEAPVHCMPALRFHPLTTSDPTWSIPKMRWVGLCVTRSFFKNPLPSIKAPLFSLSALLTRYLKENFFRAQAPSSHWGVGDWWYTRYFDIFCNDPGDKNGHSCGKQGSASGYEVEPALRKDDGKYPLINLCPSFWRMDNLAERVKNVEDGVFGFDKNDVRSLVCQGK